MIERKYAFIWSREHLCDLPSTPPHNPLGRQAAEPTASDRLSSLTKHLPDNPNDTNIPRLSDADTPTW